MAQSFSGFQRSNYLIQKSTVARWQRAQSRLHILRAQLGFNRPTGSSRPRPCMGCVHYHGVAYGYSRDTRSRLICGFHPSGWLSGPVCPDWAGEAS